MLLVGLAFLPEHLLRSVALRGELSFGSSLRLLMILSCPILGFLYYQVLCKHVI